MGRTSYRYYLIFEDRVEHIGREMRKRFPEKAGQKHPLLAVSYIREDGKLTIQHLHFNYGTLDEEGRCSKLSAASSWAKREAAKGCKVVNIMDYNQVKLTNEQQMLTALRLCADFGKAMEEFVTRRSKN